MELWSAQALSFLYAFDNPYNYSLSVPIYSSLRYCPFHICKFCPSSHTLVYGFSCSPLKFLVNILECL
jgi:hypothetical protein